MNLNKIKRWGLLATLAVTIAGLAGLVAPAAGATATPSVSNFREVINVAHPTTVSASAQAAATAQIAQLTKVGSTSAVGKRAGATSRAAAASNADANGCRYGWVCLWTVANQVEAPPNPHTDYYYYGYNNFSNVLGAHRIENNQTSGARVYLCLGYNGTNCNVYSNALGYGNIKYVPAGYVGNFNFTPINSMVLCAGPSSCPQ